MKKVVTVLVLSLCLSFSVMAEPGGVPIGGRPGSVPQTQTSESVKTTSFIQGFWSFVQAIF